MQDIHEQQTTRALVASQIECERLEELLRRLIGCVDRQGCVIPAQAENFAVTMIDARKQVRA